MTLARRHLIPIAYAAAFVTAFWVCAQSLLSAATANTPPATGVAPRGRQVVVNLNAVDVILGRPTGTTITLNVLCNAPTQGYVAYGTEKDKPAAMTEVRRFKKEEPQEILLEQLQPDTQYYYLLREGGTDKTLVEGAFHTQRAPGRAFTFDIQGDSHPERSQMFDTGLYAQTLRAAAADKPDFYMTIGDDFSVDTLPTLDAASVRQVYLRQRPFLSLVAQTAPLFLVNGNHEQAAGYLLDGTANTVPVWAQNTRNALYPMPAPDGFYTGDVKPVPNIGLLRDYYAWTWGDALFVVLDVYWHAPTAVDNVLGGTTKQRNLWQATIGDDQYQWFKKTLEGSHAKYKFVFAHHVLGTGRGGIEEATLFEWGGQDKRGVDQFKQQRPGWDMPIHQLMVKNGVTVFFQGHDHIFVHQQLDGVVYQSLPLPADPYYTLYNNDAYLTGEAFGGSGWVRVNVAPEQVNVEYVRSYLPKDETAQHKSGEVAFSYTVKAKGSGTMPAVTKPTTMTAAAPSTATATMPAVTAPVGSLFFLNVPAHPYDVILARPEKTTVTLSVLAYQDMEGYVAYGTKMGTYTTQMPMQPLKKGMPVEMLLGGLQANTRYFYQFRWRLPGTQDFTNSPEYTFQTARPAGGSFTFTLTADAHLDDRTNPEVYRRTLSNIQADKPDFHLDLGNLFMTDKHGTRDEAARQYLAQRYYLGQIGPSVPVLLALGTHDGEAGKYDDGTKDCLAVWSNLIRTRNFPNPVPDAFYSGNATPKPFCDLPQNYYAWEWGDALFVVLDPFAYSLRSRGGGRDGWDWSLGLPQYQWLAKTLVASHAKYKFIFIHNLLCGDQASRGGVEVAGFNEWGGKNLDGTDGFKAHRPGWDIPVHQLLLKNHVAAVFKAHDNFFARQELDGIVYQMIPQPSFAGDDRIRDLENYGYKQGTFQGNSGHVRVTVSPEDVRVDYVRSHLPNDASQAHPNGEISCSYEITAPKPVPMDLPTTTSPR